MLCESCRKAPFRSGFSVHNVFVAFSTVSVTVGLAVNLKDTLEDSRSFRVVLAFWFASSLIIVFLLGRIDWIMHHELYSFGLQFSYLWANPYWLSLSSIYICLAIPSFLSAVLLGFDVWKRTGGHKRSVRTEANRSSNTAARQIGESRQVSILQLIQLVDRDFDAHWYNLFLSSDMVLPLAFIVLVALMEVVLLFGDLSSHVKAVVGLSLFGAAVAFLSFMSPFIEEKSVEMNFKRLERYYWKCICSEGEIKPLLKALIKMKVKHRNIELMQIYSLDETLFDRKELLKNLYR